MKNQELKKLAKEFSQFICAKSGTIESQMSEFWFVTFSCNNSERESELLEYWKKH